MNNNKKLKDAKSELELIVSAIDRSDDRTKFREHIIEWFEKFQIFSLEAIYQYYKENKWSPSLLAEILELLGIASLNNLDSLKIDVLKHAFANENLEIRYGAVEGISNLDPKIAVPILEEFLNQENSTVLKKMIASYAEQLRGLSPC